MSEAEWLTRKSRIDARLRSLNPPWQIIPWRDDLNLSALDSVAIEEFPTANGPADYALFAGGKLLGFIEAKKAERPEPNACLANSISLWHTTQ